jgi:hypothetical protein
MEKKAQVALQKVKLNILIRGDKKISDHFARGLDK